MRIQLSIAVALMSAIAIPANLVAQIIETVPYATKKGLEPSLANWPRLKEGQISEA